MRRAQRLARDFAKDLFEKGQYNFEMYKYAIEDYFKKKREEKERQEKEQKEEATDKTQQKNSVLSRVFSLETMVQIIVLLMIVVTFIYYNKDTTFFKNVVIPMLQTKKNN